MFIVPFPMFTSHFLVRRKDSRTASSSLFDGKENVPGGYLPSAMFTYDCDIDSNF